MNVLCIGLLFAACFAVANCFSTGPPDITNNINVTLRLRNGSALTVPRGVASCDLMHPGHINVAQANDPLDPTDNGGYFIRSDLMATNYIYTSGTSYSVNLMSSLGTFRGFMIQARDENGTLIGSFSEPVENTNAIAVQTLNCDPTGVNMEAVIVHNNPPNSTDVTSLNLTWTAPDTNGTVAFTFTMVRVFSSIYVALPVIDFEPPTTQPPVTGAVSVSSDFSDFQTTTATVGAVNITAGTASNENPDYISFALSAETNGWVALGFSNTRDMLNSDVIGCIVTPDEEVRAIDTFNVIDTRRNDPDVPGDTTVQSDIVLGNGSLVDGVLSCTFARRIIGNENANMRDFDLSDSTGYFVLFGVGDTPGVNNFPVHSLQILPSISDERTSLVDGVLVLPGAESNVIGDNLLRAHGIFMLCSWGLLGLVGIYFAAWMRPIFPKGEWFQVHRAFMLGSLFTGAIGFILAFVSQYRSATPGLITLGSANPTGTTHFVFGIIIMALQIVNPIISIFRCKPDENNRWIFNLAHGSLIGTIAQALAFANMGIGLAIFAPRLTRAGDLTWFWVYLAAVIYYVILIILEIIILSVSSCVAKPEERAEIAPSLMKPLVRGSSTDAGEKIEMGAPGEPPPKGDTAASGDTCDKDCKSRKPHIVIRWVFYYLTMIVVPGLIIATLINVAIPN